MEKERVTTWIRVHSSGLPYVRARHGRGRRELAAAGLLITAGAAGAAPQPTVSQVQAKLNKLTAQENWLIQRYDQASQELSSAKQRLKLVNPEVARDQAAVHNMQGEIAQIASTAYENGSHELPAGRC